MKKIMISVAPVAATDILINPRAIARDVYECYKNGASKPAQQTSDTVPEQSKAAVRSRPKPSLETAVLAALSDG